MEGYVLRESDAMTPVGIGFTKVVRKRWMLKIFKTIP